MDDRMVCPECGHVGDIVDFVNVDSETEYLFGVCPECGHGDLEEEFGRA